MARPVNLRTKIRINLEIQPEIKDAIDYIQIKMNMDSKTEVIRRAVLLLRRVVDSDCQLIVDGKGISIF